MGGSIPTEFLKQNGRIGGLLWMGLSILCSSSTTHAADVEAIDSFLNNHLQRTGVPGFSVVIVQDDQVVLSKGYGVERTDNDAPMTERSSVAIGSLTKSFTAAVTLQLVEEGLVDLDGPVTKYLPWFRTAGGRQDEITIRCLLNNTSGIPSQDRWLFNADASEKAMERSAKALASVKLTRDPGKSFEYCNENWILLGLVLSAVSDKPYSEVLQQRVLDRLGMERSTTSLARFRDIGVLDGHHSAVQEMYPADPVFLGEALPAGSAMRASAEDMGRYLSMILGRGRYRDERLLDEASVQQWLSPAIQFRVDMPEMGLSNQTASYAMGWIVADVDGRQVVHHGGDAVVMGSWTMLDLNKRIAASVLYNGPSLDPYRFPTKLWLVNNLLHLTAGEPLSDFGIAKQQDPTKNDFVLPAGALDRYLGRYVSADGFRLDVRKGDSNEGLVLFTKSGLIEEEREIDFLSDSAVTLRNRTGHRTASFTLSADGQVTGLVGAFAGGRYRRVTSSRSDTLGSHRSPDGKVKLALPQGWAVDWLADSWEATGQSSDRITVRGGRGEVWRSVAERASRARGSRSPMPPESIGGRVWTKEIWDDQDVQCLLMSTDDSFGRYSLLLTTPRGSLTTHVREVMIPLIMDIRFGD